MKLIKTYLVVGLVLSFVTTALSFPFEGPPPQGRPFSEVQRPGYFDQGDRLPAGGPFRAEGLALKRGDACFLHIWLIDTERIPPALARGLLKENRSIDEIREEISKSGGTTTRGGMILGENRYALVEINQTLKDNCSVLDADLSEFFDILKSPEGRTIGHINIRICRDGEVMTGEGDLTVNEFGEMASYRLTFVPPTETDGNGRPATVAGGGRHPW